MPDVEIADDPMSLRSVRLPKPRSSGGRWRASVRVLEWRSRSSRDRRVRLPSADAVLTRLRNDGPERRRAVIVGGSDQRAIRREHQLLDTRNMRAELLRASHRTYVDPCQRAIIQAGPTAPAGESKRSTRWGTTRDTSFSTRRGQPWCRTHHRGCSFPVRRRLSACVPAGGEGCARSSGSIRGHVTGARAWGWRARGGARARRGWGDGARARQVDARRAARCVELAAWCRSRDARERGPGPRGRGRAASAWRAGRRRPGTAPAPRGRVAQATGNSSHLPVFRSRAPTPTSPVGAIHALSVGARTVTPSLFARCWAMARGCILRSQ